MTCDGSKLPSRGAERKIPVTLHEMELFFEVY